ncbi:MAG TPA: sodium:proton antiporter, partial [Alcanivoracaceae bacterium]|nr:sodium:proton antiporter [Alcanivoracaceae bacterium]
MLRNLLVLVTTLLASTSALAAEEVMEPLTTLGLTSSVVGYLAVAVFAVAYLLVVGEERLQMRKSKPMLLGAGLIWVLVGISSA